MNIAGIASLITNLSIETAAGRLLGRREADITELVGAALALALLCAAVGFAGAAGIGLALRTQLASTSSSADMVIAATVVLPTQCLLVTGGLLLRIGALRSYGAASSLAALAQLCAVTALYISHHITVTNALLVNVFGFSAMAVGFTGALARHVGLRAIVPRFSPRLWRSLLRACVRIHPGTVTASMNLRLDLVVVSALSSRRATGLYSLAMTLSEAAMLASLTVSQSALHVQVREGGERAARYTVDFSRHTFLLACAVTVVASAFMYPFLYVAYGHAWIGTTLPAIVTLIAVTIVTAEGPVRFMLIQVGNPFLTSVAALSALLVNLLADLLLIPLIGIVGASVATVLSYSMLTAVMLRWFRQATGVSTRGIFALPHRGDWLVDSVLGFATRGTR